jgi:hypothetical protein
VHVAVGVLIEKSYVSGQGIILFYFEGRRYLERVVVATLVSKGNVEIIQFVQDPANYGSVRLRDGDRNGFRSWYPNATSAEAYCPGK